MVSQCLGPYPPHLGPLSWADEKYSRTLYRTSDFDARVQNPGAIPTGTQDLGSVSV